MKIRVYDVNIRSLDITVIVMYAVGLMRNNTNVVDPRIYSIIVFIIVYNTCSTRIDDLERARLNRARSFNTRVTTTHTRSYVVFTSGEEPKRRTAVR